MLNVLAPSPPEPQVSSRVWPARFWQEAYPRAVH
jgi:hypothetical protein